MATILVSLDDLKASAAALTGKQAADTAALKGLFDTTSNGLVAKLETWAGLGFPLGYVVLSTTVTPPPTCLDGVTRNLPDYVAYLLGREIGEELAGLQAQVSGFTLGWSMPGGQVQVVVTA